MHLSAQLCLAVGAPCLRVAGLGFVVLSADSSWIHRRRWDSIALPCTAPLCSAECPLKALEQGRRSPRRGSRGRALLPLSCGALVQVLISHESPPNAAGNCFRLSQMKFGLSFGMATEATAHLLQDRLISQYHEDFTTLLQTRIWSFVRRL